MLKAIILVGVVLGVLKLCSLSIVAGVGWGLIAALVLVPLAIQAMVLIGVLVLAAKASR